MRSLLLIPFFLCIFCAFLPIDSDLIALSSAKLAPSFEHWFGTDLLGRDLFLRILASFKISLWIGFAASSLSLMFALIFVGFFHFYFQSLGSRIIDMFLALPSLLFVMFIQSFLRGGEGLMIFVIALGHWAFVARVLESEIVKIQHQDFYQCALVLGASKFRAFLSEILPTCFHILFVLWILNFAHAIGSEATLSFFGLGLEPTQASLGNILSDSSKAIFIGAWWMVLFPILALMTLILPLLFFAHSLQKKERA